MALFGRDFQNRVDLQRRQEFHQQLLGARSSQHGSYADRDGVPTGAKAEYAGGSSDSEAGVLALIPLSIAILIVLAAHGIRGGIIVAGAAVPAALMLMAITRLSAGDWDLGFGRALTTAFFGLFFYLAITVIVGLCVSVFHEPVTDGSWSNQLAAAIVELHQVTDISAVRLDRLPALAAAFVALHGPGLLLCGLILMFRIEEPYQERLGGIFLAWIVSFLVMPTALLLAFVIAALLRN